MNHLINKSVLATAIFLCLHGNAQAATSKALPRVVVTANRLEVPVDEALASVTLLTRADIEQSQAPDLIDLLSRQAGIDVARTGGPGSASTVFMRGSNSNHTLVLVDGIRVNSSTQGIIDFAHLPLAQIERIEIVRGPRAALWGSDAIGGVIHIFTRDPSRAFVEAHVGSYQRVGATAGIGAEWGDTRLGIAAGAEHLRGFSATNNRAYGYDPDTDGYRNRNVSVRGQTVIGTQRLSGSALLTDADVEFDQGRTSAINRVFGVNLAGDLSARWSHSLTLGRSSEQLDTPAYSSRFGSSRNSVDWINTLQLDRDNTVNVGFNWSHESAFTDGSYEHARRNTALFASWRGRFATHLLDVSLRRDDNSQFDGATTGNIAWGWQASDALRVRASWGQGFRAPNFNELYYPGFGVGGGVVLFAGNADLQPERSTSSEIGMDWTPHVGQRFAASAFRTRINDLIGFDGPLFGAINIGRAAIDGVELEYHLSRGSFFLDSNATWQHARNTSSGEPLLRRADRKLFVSGNYKFSAELLCGIDVSAFSSRPDFGAVQLPGYARIDVRGSVALPLGWSLEGRIENLGSRAYSLVDGYNTPGRSGMLTLRWNAQ